jgi:protein TonB
VAVASLCAVLLAAATQAAATQAAATQAAAAAEPQAAQCGPGPSKAGDSLARYKHDVACRIHARNESHLYEGAPPPVLRSVVVLSLRVDSRGRPVRIGVVRSNGIRALERRAVQSVRAAAPLPIPHAALLRRGAAEITETWLFRDDGRFQIRTLAQVQAPSGY